MTAPLASYGPYAFGLVSVIVLLAALRWLFKDLIGTAFQTSNALLKTSENLLRLEGKLTDRVRQARKARTAKDPEPTP